MEKSTTQTISQQMEGTEAQPSRLQWEPVTWYKDPGLRKLYLMMPVLYFSATVRGYDTSLLNGLQTLVPWQNYFDHPTGSDLGLITAIINVGSFAAVFFTPFLADRLGRKWTTALGNVFLLAGAVMQVVPTTTRAIFIGGRFLIGFGAIITEGGAPLLILELAHPQHRGILTTLFNTLWFLGSIIAAWTTYGTLGYHDDRSWRIPVAVQVLMPAIQIATIWFLPESPRWLIARDHDDKAFQILTKYHANGNPNDPFLQWEYNEIRETLRLEKESAKHSWSVFFRTPGNRKRFIVIALVSFFSQCSGNGLVSYYIHSILTSVGVTSSSDQALINGGVQIWSMLTAMGFAFLVERVGRRKLFLIAGVGMLVTFSIWTACSAVYAQTGNTGAGGAVIAMIFCFYGVAGFAWPGLTVAYISEILPYTIRAKGLALNFAFTACASTINQYVNPIGLQHLAWRFYFVYIVILVLDVLVIYFYFPETRGYTLEEVAVLFDGKDGIIGGTDQLAYLEKEVEMGSGINIEDRDRS